MRRLLPALLLASCLLSAEDGRATRLAAALRELALDSGECYRVRDLNFAKEDARFYLTDGYLIFAKPVNGRRVAAVFTAEVEGGDAEILLMPPHRSERMALANFTKSPNLSERFRSAVMIFTDDSAAEFLARIRERRELTPDLPGQSPEMGALLEGRWTPVVRNFLSSFEVRLVDDLLAARPAAEGCFYAALAGRQLGNFDLVYDPRARDQITLGQVAYRDNRVYFDIWASFEARSFRRDGRARARPEFTIGGVRIDAAFDKDLRLSATTTLAVSPSVRITGALPLEISRKMKVTGATVEGQPADVLQPESLRANLLRGPDNATILVVPPQPLETGRSYRVEIRHEGEVVTDAGRGVYFVASRGTWYPNRWLQFAAYDVTFRYPATLDLVATGDIVEDRTEAEWHTTRRRTSVPIRFAGFNLGQYSRAVAGQGGYTVEVYGNRQFEREYEAKSKELTIVPPPLPPVWPRSPQRPSLPPQVFSPAPESLPPSPAVRLTQLAGEIASALDFMASRFGPPPFKRLTVAPIPGSFGQGFPGLIYLSTLSYLLPSQRLADTGRQDESEKLFFSDLLQAHETAHQWWGNVVATADYQDDWLMEGLAGYSALLYIEKKKGPRVIDSVLEGYKTRLLAKEPDGRTLESAGPITWSMRLYSSLAPQAWRIITYEKGSWIIHMLRRRMGDERFFAMLAELCRRYRFKPVSTGEFQRLAVEYLPKGSRDPNLDSFFEQWVYGTGIPTLKFTHSLKGKVPALKLTGTVTQSDVPDDFSALVPVEIQFGKGKSQIEWVETGEEPVSFTVNLKQAPLKVVMDPGGAVLAKR